MKNDNASGIGLVHPLQPPSAREESRECDAAWLHALIRSGEPHAVVQREVAARTEASLAARGRGLRLAGARLAAADLRELDLRSADLTRAELHQAQLDGACLSRATLVCPAMEKTSLRGADLRGAYVHALAAQVCDFSGADLRDLVDATGALFHGCKLVDTDLRGTTLSGTTFYQCTLDGSDAREAQLQSCTIAESRCHATRFDGADLDHATFNRSELTGTRLDGAHGVAVSILMPLSARGLVLERAVLPELRVIGLHASGLQAAGIVARGSIWHRSSLSRARLDGADLAGAHFVDCQLDDAHLGGAMLDDASWLRVTADRARLVRASAESWSVTGGSLVAADLSGLKGRCVRVRNSDWHGVSLRDAYLYRAFITGDPPVSMCLAHADLTGAVIVQAYFAADFEAATLTGVAAAYARLNQSRFDEADLRGMSWFEASMVKCSFDRAQLQGVEAPWFADRCAGLEEALGRCEASPGTIAFAEALRELLGGERRGST